MSDDEIYGGNRRKQCELAQSIMNAAIDKINRLGIKVHLATSVITKDKLLFRFEEPDPPKVMIDRPRCKVCNAPLKRQNTNLLCNIHRTHNLSNR